MANQPPGFGREIPNRNIRLEPRLVRDLKIDGDGSVGAVQPSAILVDMDRNGWIDLDAPIDHPNQASGCLLVRWKECKFELYLNSAQFVWVRQWIPTEHPGRFAPVHVVQQSAPTQL